MANTNNTNILGLILTRIFKRGPLFWLLLILVATGNIRAVITVYILWFLITTVNNSIYIKSNAYSATTEFDYDRFLGLMFTTMGYIARYSRFNHRADHLYAETIIYSFNLEGAKYKQALSDFRKGERAISDFRFTLYELKTCLLYSTEYIGILMKILVGQALANKRWNKQKYFILVKVARVLKFPREQLHILLRNQQNYYQQHDYQQQSSHKAQQTQASATNYEIPTTLHQAYAILGVSENSSMAEIKAAYRRLISKHHPDKMAAANYSANLIKMAKAKTQQLVAAYDLIKKYGSFN